MDYYKTALKVLEQSNNSPDGNSVVEVAGSKTYKSWKKYAEFKMAFHQSVALLYMGIHSEELQKMGERLAYYQVYYCCYFSFVQNLIIFCIVAL